MWNYFADFWNAITSQVVGGVEYTIGYFQQIGNAVAGALGQFFNETFHLATDFFAFFNYLAISLKQIFLAIISPVNYIFTILRNVYSISFSTPPAPEITTTFSPGVLSVFQSIPHWGLISSTLGVAISLVLGVATIKLLLKT